MQDCYGEFIGVDKVYTFDVNTDTLDAYVTGTPAYLAPVAEISGEAKTDNNTTYYDNKAGNNYVSEAATELKLTFSGVPADVIADLLGKAYDATTGRVYDDGEPNPPQKGLMFRYNMGKGNYRYFCYLNGTFSGGKEEATTKGEKVEVKTTELTYTAVNTTHEWTIKKDGVDTLTSLKRVFGDTANAAFNATDWFTQAQTPTTATPPAELTLTSVPADSATAVAVGANVVLTFSNKIASYNVSMVKSDFTTVATTNSFDTAGKVLTLNPNADLAAASSYAVILSNVKDVYGQSLADQVINFTTA